MPSASKPKQHGGPGGTAGKTWRWFKGALIALVALTALAVAAVVLTIRHYEADLPSLDEVQTYRPPQVTRVLARDGSLLAELFTERRTVVPFNELPPEVKLAVLAAEDAYFYQHEGLNYFGMLRALVVNLRSGKTRQGASTITQQVVKNVLLDSERSYRRKVREVILARRLEQNLSKDKILELYVNHIYFGHGRYGVEEAAQFYFGVSARKLSLSQAATLAGLVASPEHFSPRHGPELAEQRRRFVLSQMLEKNFINDAQHDEALAAPIALASPFSPPDQVAPEVVEIVKRTLRDVAGPGAALGGYTVTTTIDPALQAAARKAIQDNLKAYDKRHKLLAPLQPEKQHKRGRKKATAPFEGTPKFTEHKVLVGEVTGADDENGLLRVRVGTVKGVVRLADYERYNPDKLPPSKFAPTGALLRVSLTAPEPAAPQAPDAPPVPLRLELGPQGALVAIDVRSRHVLALVGSYEVQPGGLDRATRAKRQPGSTFKPFVYGYALQTRRFTPATLLETRAGTIRGYQAANYAEGEATAPMRLRQALADSINVAAVHVARDVGPQNVVAWARALGITTPMGADLSLALGAYETKPIEMANAYATFASGGTFDTPRIVLRVTGPDGKEIPLPEAPPARRVMEENEAFLITSVLTSVVNEGTGQRAKKLKRPVAGKTGTSNDYKDAWFVGYSTDIACAVWTGYDDALPLGAGESGAGAALPAWVMFMEKAHLGRPPTDFPRPQDLVTLKIDPATGLVAREDQPDAPAEYFLPGTEPTELAVDPDAGAALAMESPTEPGLVLPAVEHTDETLPALPPAEAEPVPLF